MDTHGKMKLIYWSGRGAMEPARQCLALGGKFPPNDYEDFRATSPPSDLPNENCGRVPILIAADGKVVGQSAAIWRFTARENNLLGSNSIENAQIDCISETIKEMIEAWYKIMPYGNTFDDEKKARIKDHLVQS